MSNASPVPWVTRAYAVLLYLYPIHYRDVYAEEMKLTFRDLATDAYETGGTLALCGLSLRTLGNALIQSTRERFHYFIFRKEYAGIEGTFQPISGVRLFLWLATIAGSIAVIFSQMYWSYTDAGSIFFVLYFLILGYFTYKKYGSWVLSLSLTGLGILLAYAFSTIFEDFVFSWISPAVDWITQHSSATVLTNVSNGIDKIFFIVPGLVIGLLIIRQVERRKPGRVWQRLSTLLNYQNQAEKKYFQQLFIRNVILSLLVLALLFFAMALSTIREMGSYSDIPLSSVLQPLFEGFYTSQSMSIWYSLISPAALLTTIYLICVTAYFSYGLFRKRLIPAVIATVVAISIFTFFQGVVSYYLQMQTTPLPISDARGYQIEESCAVQAASQYGGAYTAEQLELQEYIPASAIPSIQPGPELCNQASTFVKDGITYQGLGSSVTSKGVATNFYYTGEIPSKINLDRLSYWGAASVIWLADFGLPTLLLTTLVLLGASLWKTRKK